MKKEAIAAVVEAGNAMRKAIVDDNPLIDTGSAIGMALYKSIHAWDAAIASLPIEGGGPNQAIAEECATRPIIGNVRERWEELGYNDPDRVAERFRGDHWKSFYAGWIEGRWPLVVGKEGKLTGEEDQTT